MAKQLITIGTPGAGGGDPAHAAFKKINDNTNDVYSFLGAGESGVLTAEGAREALNTYSKGEVYSKDEADSLFAIDDALKYMPIAWPKSAAPTGYLVMMGQAISQATYPKLYALYGSKLPDMRAYTIRGLDNGRGIDTGRVVLSEQGDAIREIQGGFTASVPRNHGEYRTGVFDAASGASTSQTTTAATYEYQETIEANKSRESQRYGYQFKSSLVVPTAPENRVKNIAFLYIVKAG